METKSQIKDILNDELTKLRDRIIANHRNAGQNASNRTIESMIVETTSDTGVLYGRRALGTLETGRKGGGVPKNFVQIIQQWIVDKGIQVDPIPYERQSSERWQPKYTPDIRGRMSLAGAIAHKIAREGTKLYKSGGRNDIYSNCIPETLQSISNRLAGIVGTQIDTINLNSKSDEKS